MVKQWNPEKNCYRSKYDYQTSFKEVLSTKNAGYLHSHLQKKDFDRETF